jgi:CHASE3 domain sensor protein
MPNRQLKNTIALLEGLEESKGLTTQQRKQLRRARLKLSFYWLPQFFLHGSFVVVVLLSYLHLKHLDHVNAIYSAADRLDLALTKTESSQRGYLLTGKQVYLSDYNFYAKIAHARMADLCLLIPSNDYNDKLCQNLEQDITAKLDEMQSTVEAAKAGNYAKALQIVRTDRGFHISLGITKHLGNIRLEVQQGHISHHGSCLVP